MSSSKLILPLIHLGGSGPSTLLADYSAAIVALQEALRLLGESYHDRDYYLLGQTVHREARNQHLDRCAAIGSVIVALRSMQDHAADERAAAAARRILTQEEAKWVEQHETLHLHARAAADAAYADAYDADHR